MRQSALIVLSTLICIHVTAPTLRKLLGHAPELVPIWWPVSNIRVPLLLRLPNEHRNRVRRIHAANQYVEVVTETGTTLLRMSLKNAIALLPEASGWHCHRSLWIARDEVQDLVYFKGQPRVIDMEGLSFAISRAHVPEIRAHLARKRDTE